MNRKVFGASFLYWVDFTVPSLFSPINLRRNLFRWFVVRVIRQFKISINFINNVPWFFILQFIYIVFDGVFFFLFGFFIFNWFFSRVFWFVIIDDILLRFCNIWNLGTHINTVWDLMVDNSDFAIYGYKILYTVVCILVRIQPF